MNHRRMRRGLVSAILITGQLLGMAVSGRGDGLIGHFAGRRGHQDAVACPRSLEELGKMIDALDEELFEEGVVGVKAPDVWGQNRMTKYRHEYEQEMVKEVDKFKVRLNAAIRRADSAVLTSATGLGAAIGPSATPAAGAEAEVTVTPPEADAGALLKSISERLDVLAATDLLKLPDDFLTGENRIGLEPTIELDEKSRYLDHLHELRRAHAGDDLTDSPGYGLYLIRMPVSLLPGPEVRRGNGAVVTVEAEHALSPDLLANTFRDVVIMDAAYQLSPILLKLLHDVETTSRVPIVHPPVTNYPDVPLPPGIILGEVAQECPAGTTQNQTSTYAAQAEAGNPTGVSSTTPLSESKDLYGEELDVLIAAIKKDQADWYRHDPSVISWLINELGAAHYFMREQARNGQLGYLFQGPQFQIIDTLIQNRNYRELARFRKKFIADLVLLRNGFPPLNESAYYNSPCTTPQGSMVPYRQAIDEYLKARERPTDVLVFALMVQSVLVDRRLKHDMDVIAERKGCPCVGDLNVLSFYDLFPSPEAREAFNAYVACKWPIHIFALDPAVDQQNQLDLFSARSELQMALAVALATGQINFNQATSYARRLETDIATINLNRTAIGFGAGDTTFGWRFYPRIQSPPTPGTLRRVGGLLGGTSYNQNYISRNQRIEPGPRECVALMVVPDFVPAIHFTTFANWFEYTGPHADQKFDTGDLLEFSRELQAAKVALGQVCDLGLYRPGELNRLASRLEQLDAMLPTQDFRVPLPHEGDLTGSEIFSSTGARLAPRLLTWYGEPPRANETSTIFVLGTNFSVHETRVIAGGVGVTNFRPISRNVLEIDIPSTARPTRTQDGRLIFDVHVATSNGISNHLFVETTPAPSTATAAPAYGYTIAPESLNLTITLGCPINGQWSSIVGRFGDGAVVAIKLDEPIGIQPNAITPTFVLPLFENEALASYTPPVPIAYNSAAGAYVIAGDLLNGLANHIAMGLHCSGRIVPGKVPSELTSNPILIRPLVPEFATQSRKANNSIKVNLKFVYSPVTPMGVTSPMNAASPQFERIVPGAESVPTPPQASPDQSPPFAPDEVVPVGPAPTDLEGRTVVPSPPGNNLLPIAPGGGIPLAPAPAIPENPPAVPSPPGNGLIPSLEPLAPSMRLARPSRGGHNAGNLGRDHRRPRQGGQPERQTPSRPGHGPRCTPGPPSWRAAVLAQKGVEPASTVILGGSERPGPSMRSTGNGATGAFQCETAPASPMDAGAVVRYYACRLSGWVRNSAGRAGHGGEWPRRPARSPAG